MVPVLTELFIYIYIPVLTEFYIYIYIYNVCVCVYARRSLRKYLVFLLDLDERQTMTKTIVAFRNFANVHTNTLWNKMLTFMSYGSVCV